MKRCGFVAWAFLFAWGCTDSGTAGTPGTGDTGGNPDGSDGPTCAERADAVRAEAARINTCSWMTDCVDNPTGICNIAELPCGQVWLHVGTPENAIDDLGEAYIQAGCNSDTCHCDDPPETLFCIDGTCRATATCQELLDRIDALEASADATACAIDGDCAIGYSDKAPLCAPADACWCTFALAAGTMDEVQQLIDLAAGQGCTTTETVCECVAVDCKTRTPKCQAGHCAMVFGS